MRSAIFVVDLTRFDAAPLSFSRLSLLQWMHVRLTQIS
jgi:hypothetical protein